MDAGKPPWADRNAAGTAGHQAHRDRLAGACGAGGAREPRNLEGGATTFLRPLPTPTMGREPERDRPLCRPPASPTSWLREDTQLEVGGRDLPEGVQEGGG